jgi:hypothetical protein
LRYSNSMKQATRRKFREWTRRYLPAEILGTITALLGAWISFEHTHSYLAATAAGLLGEGIGFFGYFITVELLTHSKQYKDYPFFKRIGLIIGKASTNLLVEFGPAELLDAYLVRPVAMFIIPQHVHPYAIGFLAAKFSADILFYAIAITGYETRKRFAHAKAEKTGGQKPL